MDKVVIQDFTRYCSYTNGIRRSKLTMYCLVPDFVLCMSAKYVKIGRQQTKLLQL